MKKSQIVLATTGFLLAIAGAYATKASKSAHLVKAFTIASGVCHFIKVTAATAIKPALNPHTKLLNGVTAITGRTSASGPVCGTRTLWTKVN